MYGDFRKNENGHVDEEAFVSHWDSLVDRVAATDFFAVMDANSSGELTQKEFVTFWGLVKEQKKLSEDEIIV